MTRKALTPPKNKKKTFIKKRTRKVSKETRDIPDPSRATSPVRRVLLEVAVLGDHQELGLVLGWTEEADGLRASGVDLDPRTARGLKKMCRDLLKRHAEAVDKRAVAIQRYIEKGTPIGKRIKGGFLLAQSIKLDRKERERRADGKKPLDFQDYDDMSKEVE